MGNTLKIKLGLIIFSLILLILIPLLDNNFYAPVTYKKWQQLTWDDFQGFAKPFTGWGAGISSLIRVEWDSVANKYTANAIQNNQKSWRRKNLNNPDYLLNHEQYHFNITELHARMMNEYLDSISQLGIINFEDKFLTLRLELKRMQSLYDNESDHGVNWGMQRRWEYKIDSMLQHYSNTEGVITDYFSGAQVYFSSAPKLRKLQTAGYHPARSYQLIDYDMVLTLYLSHDDSPMDLNVNADIKEFYKNVNYEIVSIKTIEGNYDFEVMVDAKDTSSNKVSARWIYSNSILYRISAEYPNNNTESGFKEIADSFFDSFKIIDVEDYWFSKYGLDEEYVEKNPVSHDENTICLVHNTQEQSGFYAGPFIREGVGLLVSSDIDNSKNNIHQSMAIINKKSYTALPEDDVQVYFVPYNHIPDKSFQVDIGIVLKEDTLAVCPPYYSQSWRIEKSGQ